VSSVNAAGGINGHPVKVIFKDDAADTAKALQAAKELIESDHVMALVDNSLVDAAFQSYVSQSGVPVVGGIAISLPFLTNPDFFTVGSSLPVITVGQALLGKQAGVKKLGTMYCNETPLCKQVVPLVQLATKLAGLGFTSQAISSVSPSYAAPCLSFKGQSADGLFVADNGTTVLNVQRGCAQQGYKALAVNNMTTFTRSWLSEPSFNGAVTAGTNAVYTDTSLPGIKTFIDALNKYAPGTTTSPQFTYDTLYPWLAGKLFEAAAHAGNLTPTSTSADIKKALYSLKSETLGGLAPPLTFTPGKPAFTPCYFGGTIKSGQLNSLNNGQALCLNQTQTVALATALKQLG
jgi:branched-chain amino acid transport system substrate-binding protein